MNGRHSPTAGFDALAIYCSIYKYILTFDGVALPFDLLICFSRVSTSRFSVLLHSLLASIEYNNRSFYLLYDIIYITKLSILSTYYVIDFPGRHFAAFSKI